MEKYCISLPQAKRLRELGFWEESRYAWQEEKAYPGHFFLVDIAKTGYDPEYFIYYPAYHVGELGEILEHWLGVIRYEEDWVVDHWTERGGELKVRLITEAQARGRLLIYLLENGLI